MLCLVFAACYQYEDDYYYPYRERPRRGYLSDHHRTLDTGSGGFMMKLVNGYADARGYAAEKIQGHFTDKLPKPFDTFVEKAGNMGAKVYDQWTDIRPRDNFPSSSRNAVVSLLKGNQAIKRAAFVAPLAQFGYDRYMGNNKY
jgi:hypothetical protein